jgi:hypothetical protein
MTYEELLALAKTGDPLIDMERPDSASITSDGLLILGSADGGYMSDMLVRIEPDASMRVWVRDPSGTSADDCFHGPDWTAETVFRDYEDLVTWAYSW